MGDEPNPYEAPASDPRVPSPVEPKPKTALDLVRAIVTDSIRYWEFMRLIYNGVLTLLTVVGIVVVGIRASELIMLVGLAFLAVLANLCYCLVYPIDLFIQLSNYQEAWRKARILLFLVGLGLASSLTAAAIFMMR